MSKRLGEYAFFSLVSALLLTVTFGAGFFSRELLQPTSAQSAGEPLPLLNQAKGILEGHYLGELPDAKHLEYGMIRGMVQAVNDPYTAFVEPPAHELETDNLQGEYGGIGVALARDDAGNLLLTPLPDSPAAGAGVLDGDILKKVDGTVIATEMSMDEIGALIRGPVGEAVAIVVLRGPTELEFTIVRQVLEIPSVTWRLADTQPDTGIIAVSRFSEKTADEVERAWADLKGRGATRVILDLRNNGGGLLDMAVQVASQFLDGGVVMHEVRRGEPEKTFRAPSGGVLAGVPLVVLVNHGTASAAEIVAGALQDRERGPLIGQTTFGKGSVQLVFDLADGSSLHVTAAKWFTPDRRPIDGQGLTPDLAVESAADGSEAELARALEYLRTGN